MTARFALPLLLAALLACSKDDPKSTRWDTAADAAAQRATAAATTPAAPVAAGGSLNAAFPPEADGYKRVFTQEKDGFAEAKLQKDGKDVATLSVADTNANAEAKAKFADAKEKLAEWPLMTVGKNQSTLLVKDRWQVKVSSPTLDHEARKEILAKFDLGRLPK